MGGGGETTIYGARAVCDRCGIEVYTHTRLAIIWLRLLEILHPHNLATTSPRCIPSHDSDADKTTFGARGEHTTLLRVWNLNGISPEQVTRETIA